MFGRFSIAYRVTLLALVLVAAYRTYLTFVVMGPAQVIDGLFAADGVTIAMSVTYLIAVVSLLLALGGRAAGLFLGALVLAVNMVFSGPFLVKDLADPHRLASWAWSLTVLSGNALGIVFGAVAIAERFWPALPARSRRMQGLLLKGSVAAVGGMLLLGLLLSLGAAPSTDVAGAPDAVITVELKDMRFQPDHLELSKGERTALFLINRDGIQHTFDSDALDIHVTVPAQSSTVIFVERMESGEFDLYCAIAGHEVAGMAGSIAVK